MYFCLLHFYWPPSNCHVHISLPCFLTSEIIKESMRDSKNFKAHLKMCKDYMGSTLQNDLELRYSLQRGQNTDTRFNAQVSELKKNLTVRYSFGTPFKSSSQDNCSQKFKCQILWSSTFFTQSNTWHSMFLCHPIKGVFFFFKWPLEYFASCLLFFGYTYIVDY